MSDLAPLLDNERARFDFQRMKHGGVIVIVLSIIAACLGGIPFLAYAGLTGAIGFGMAIYGNAKYQALDDENRVLRRQLQKSNEHVVEADAAGMKTKNRINAVESALVARDNASRGR